MSFLDLRHDADVLASTLGCVDATNADEVMAQIECLPGLLRFHADVWEAELRARDVQRRSRAGRFRAAVLRWQNFRRIGLPFVAALQETWRMR